MIDSFVRLRRWLPPGGALLLVALAFLAPVKAEEPDRDKDRSKGKKTNAAQLQVFDIEFSDVNDILLAIVNDGRIGNDSRFSDECAGFFPALSDNCYVFGSGIWVGGIVNGTRIISSAYDAATGTSEMEPGRSPERGGGADRVLCSNDAGDLAEWYEEFSDPTTGEPILFSQKDCIVIYHDANQGRDVFTPIGLEIEQRTMAFTFGLLSRVVFVVWDIENTSPNLVDDTFVAINADMDIGDAAEDDRCSAVVEVPPGPNNPSSETVQTNLGICWDSDFNEVSFNPNPPGFVGITFFQGPVSEEGDTLGLTRFTLTTRGDEGRPQPDPTTDGAQYDLLAGLGARVPFVDATSTDVRFVEISGPFDLQAGQTQRVVVGYVFANVSNGRTSLEVSPTRCFPAGQPCFLPDPNDPALEELVRVQRAAQVIFNAGFLAPAPPPKPDITLIPGNQQATIVWSDVSRVPDPFFAIAGDSTNPAFDPLFREQDFEGFVLVRSTSGLTNDVDTLAIFDVVNDVATIIDTTILPVSVGDSIIEVVAEETPIINLPNTGLQFSFVDRGLINGILYFYDVVPFDFNPSNTLRGPEISLSGGISFQPREVKSVRPRSDASSFEAANAQFVALKADGTVCDTDEATATVDPTTGAYVDLLDCSNAVVQATLTPLRDLNIPTGEFTFVIDSILPGDTFDPTGGNTDTGEPGYVVAEGTNVVWFHWEDASGNLATAIQPNVGSFTQGELFAAPRFNIGTQTPVTFSLDSDPSDVGPDLSVSLVVAMDFNHLEDLEVNGRSLALLQLGGESAGESRPHVVVNSELADAVLLSGDRKVGAFREYSLAGAYTGPGAYELTWSVSGGSFTGTVRRLPGGEVVPPGGQAKGSENPSTPGDNIGGWNWGFVTGTPDAVAPDESCLGVALGEPGSECGTIKEALYPGFGPLTNTINLNIGESLGLYVPGSSLYIEGLRQLPQNGDTWIVRLEPGGDRPGHGRDPTDEGDPIAGPFTYIDENQGFLTEVAPIERGIVNVYPGARWRLSVTGGSNAPGDVDLARIKTVPNPYFANAIWDFSQDDQRVEFINLPPVCTIRIYTLDGSLVRVLEHTNGSGTEPWDLRTRFNLKAASGTYYWHVTTPDGETQLGLMSIIQNAPGAT
jgi:hypothetical protein